ncbi:DUF4190 domain-containing protein [Streptomyces verrucosisporus]|uniref:DUF4190 domain-containing protein n=1 Tax=Streptomyces verrucosisporus TaxID=1695161 RepID=UPI0019D29DA7|nr:DUF4190 domain-containing protein [Streptomyces verrucosisporus]MBN3930955.1 DUF4190 domain-containing protein [Streptomyces verrucosisporus]
MPENPGPGEGVPLGKAGGQEAGPSPSGRPAVTAFVPPAGQPQQPQPPVQGYGQWPGQGHAYGGPWPGAVPQPGHGYGPAGPVAGWMPPPRPPQTSGICTAAMVLGIVSMVLVTTFYGAVLAVVTGPVAIGLGITARRRVKRGQAYGSGQATAGLVLGVVSFVASAALIALGAWFVLNIDRFEPEEEWHEDTNHTQVVDRAPASGGYGPPAGAV